MKKATAKSKFNPSHLPPRGAGVGTFQEMNLQVAEVS